MGFKRKFFILIFLIEIILISMPIVSKAEKIIRISTFDYPPLMKAEKIEGKGYGIGIDIARAAFERVNIKAVFDFFPMKRSIFMLNSGDYIAQLGTIYHFREALEEKKVVGVKIMDLRFSLYYLKSRFRKISFKNIKDLKRYTIGNVRGSSSSSLLMNKGLSIDWTNSIEQNFIKFFKGRFDLCLAEDHAAMFILHNDYPNMKDSVARVDKPIQVVPKNMTFPATHRDLAERFRKGLSIIKKDGTFDRVLIKYLGVKKDY